MARKTNGSLIAEVRARQVLDSRGNPTVEARVRTRVAEARASVPSGASTGTNEAVELRDGDKARFHGKGVLRAVSNVNSEISSAVIGMDSANQRLLDRTLVAMDGTPNKGRLGANAILSVSMAACRAAAISSGEQLFEHVRKRRTYELPVPMMNVINGGLHAGNGLAVQEFLIEPVGAESCSDAIRIGVEVYQTLKSVLEAGYGKVATNVGDEGGFAPPMKKTRQALDAIAKAVRASGFTEGEVRLGIDAAATTFYEEKTKRYSIDGDSLTPDRLEAYYASMKDEYGLLTIEDPFEETALGDFHSLTRRVGDGTITIGDDVYVTSSARILEGIRLGATNGVLIKLNQAGTVTETEEAMRAASSAGWSVTVSHRSGETEDPFIAHLATAFGVDFIKAGAPARGERVAKYNELLRIEEWLGSRARFSGRRVRSRRAG